MTKTNDDIHVNKKYKDTVFRKLFGENKGNALSLYNAVNHTSYTDPDDLEYTTLEDVIYMKYKNDVSFLIDKTLSLYEHQSSYNPHCLVHGSMGSFSDNETISIPAPLPKYRYQWHPLSYT